MGNDRHPDLGDPEIIAQLQDFHRDRPKPAPEPKRYNAQTVGCGGGDDHDIVTLQGRPAKPCLICALREDLRTSMGVMDLVLNTLIEGRVVAAADILREHLRAIEHRGAEQLGSEKKT